MLLHRAGFTSKARLCESLHFALILGARLHAPTLTSETRCLPACLPTGRLADSANLALESRRGERRKRASMRLYGPTGFITHKGARLKTLVVPRKGDGVSSVLTSYHQRPVAKQARTRSLIMNIALKHMLFDVSIIRARGLYVIRKILHNAFGSL